MANTYTQIHIQVVFAVRHRQCLIKEEWEDKLYAYMTGIIQNHGHKLLIINGMPDHVHIFFGFRPIQSLSNLMQQVKEKSSKWVNNEGFSQQKFTWQSGYGAFSYHKSMIPTIIRYIENQKEHHRKKSFLEEYEEYLKEFGIDYDNRFLFDQIL